MDDEIILWVRDNGIGVVSLACILLSKYWFISPYSHNIKYYFTIVCINNG